MATEQASGYPGYMGYGGYGMGGYGLDPASMKSRLALALMNQGMDSAPIRSPWQGAARMGNALVGALLMRQGLGAAEGERQKALGYAGNLGMGTPVPAAPALSGGVPSPVASSIPPGTYSPSPITGGSVIPSALTQPNGAAGGANPNYVDPRFVGNPVASLAPPGAGVQVASLDPNFVPAMGGGVPPGVLAGAAPQTFTPANVGASSLNPFMVPSSASAAAGQGNIGAAPRGPMPLMGALTNMGYSPVAAAGILGNFQQESGFNPASVGDGGTSIGLGQWHASRAQALQQFAQSQGSDWRDPSVQLAFADREIKSNPQLFQALLQTAQSPQQAADIFSSGFERPDPKYAMNDRREAFASQALGGAGTPMPTPGAAPLNMSGPGQNGLDPMMMVAGPGAPMPGRGGASPNPMPPSGPPLPPPNGGAGGFDPLAAIGNGINGLFGGANPSSPQGANSAAPAAPGGAPQGGQGQDIRGLMEIMSNPYASPQTREMAGMLLQRAIPRYSYETIPGANELMQLDQFGRPTGQRVQGGPITKELAPGNTLLQAQPNGSGFQTVAGGPDTGAAYAQSQAAAKARGEANPWPSAPLGGGSAVPGAAIPPTNLAPPTAFPGAGAAVQPAATGTATSDPFTAFKVAGEDKLPAIAAQIAQQYGPDLAQQAELRARAFLRGGMVMPQQGTAIKDPIDRLATTMALQADPNFNSQIAANRGVAIKQFMDQQTPSSAGGMILNANTALHHLGALSDASEELAPLQSANYPLYNRLQGLVQGETNASGPYAQAQARFDAAKVPFVQEFTKFLAGGEGTDATRQLMNEAVNENDSPAQRRAALGQIASLLNDKVGVLQQQWHTAMGEGASDFPVKYPDAAGISTRVQSLYQPITSVKNPTDVAALPKGTRFVIPDGSGRIGIAK